MNYYAWKMRAPRSQFFLFQMNYRHPMQLKKSKSWGPFLSYQLNSAANPAHLPRKCAKWAGLVVLFSWKLQNCSQDFDSFNCQNFILAEIHCYLSAIKSWHNNLFLTANIFESGPMPTPWKSLDRTPLLSSSKLGQN